MTGSETRETTIKRLHMRSMRRGIKEMDLILIRYAGARLEEMDQDGLQIYDALLSENDQDLYQWVTGQLPAPDRFVPLVADIREIATG
ncbi:succinate dehydrogenase assembly factor 2 [Puniceibacterium sediminis]|uniref:FAD assembly factor SdhE n=1 Tax=Puniceibacterium sediminis TaxID=1608407 RepID=A0A238YT74_9RHOB|nr:succinate dehydrogenase assembly factor 2 [Puniceibacterium sediminis]SNR73793.1 antitoxin CptB [Puniceibacterium sediminis]